MNAAAQVGISEGQQAALPSFRRAVAAETTAQPSSGIFPRSPVIVKPSAVQPPGEGGSAKELVQGYSDKETLNKHGPAILRADQSRRSKLAPFSRSVPAATHLARFMRIAASNSVDFLESADVSVVKNAARSRP
ncbi:MAG: hypothetical protein NT069_06925 [Planctomycetota bacterium]|nr:hypothetical protein [Planctomycetota bacterium]